MLLTVCIEAGRSTLTHTSWTGPAPVSRKWMSGQAAALAAQKDRTPFANSIVPLPLRESSLPSTRRPPSPLDFYLSWMSPHSPLLQQVAQSQFRFRVVFHSSKRKLSAQFSASCVPTTNPQNLANVLIKSAVNSELALTSVSQA